MIIPVSAYNSDRMLPVQNIFQRSKQMGWVQTYHIRPAKLFAGAEQRLAIYIVQRGSTLSDALYSSRYNKWNEQFREHLFAVTEYVDITQIPFQNSIPKMHSEIEQNLWKKMAQFSTLETHISKRRASHTIYFHDSPGYWIRAMDFVPYFWNESDGEGISTHVRPLHLTTELGAIVVAATLNSSLFYWWYVILSDCRSLTSREIRSFPIGVDKMETSVEQTLSVVSADLMKDLKHYAQRKERYQRLTGLVVYDEFYPRHSKAIINEIDRVLAKHYGFTDEELDFIINYDVKYRMGLGN